MSTVYNIIAINFKGKINYKYCQEIADASSVGITAD